MGRMTDAELLDLVSTPGWFERSLLRRATESGACLLWARAIGSSGYGNITVSIPGGGMRSSSAHRLAWIARNGRVPSRDEQIDHLCRERRCINPDHLQVVSPSENSRLVGARTRTASAARLAQTGSIRTRVLADGTARYAATFRDRVDGRAVQRSRTFGTRAECEAFLADLAARDITDLIAS